MNNILSNNHCPRNMQRLSDCQNVHFVIIMKKILANGDLVSHHWWHWARVGITGWSSTFFMRGWNIDFIIPGQESWLSRIQFWRYLIWSNVVFVGGQSKRQLTLGLQMNGWIARWIIVFLIQGSAWCNIWCWICWIDCFCASVW